MENRHIPEIRFPGFNGHWELCKLKDISKIYDGTHQTPKYTDSGIKFVSVEDINDIEASNKYISIEDYETQFKNKPEVGDIFMTRITAGVIGATAVIESDEPFAYYVSLALIKPNKNNSGLFVSSYISTKGFKKELNKRIIHTAFPKKINLLDIGECSILKPQEEEQIKIGGFYKKLDETIAFHEQELTTLKKTKQGFLQKMFPKEGESVPEIRFPGFTGDWQQRMFGNAVDISTNMVDPKTGKYDSLLHIGPGNIESFTGRVLNNVKTVREENLISGKFYFKPGDIIYGKINPQLGKYAMPDFEGLSSADAYVLNSKNDVIQSYLYTILQTSNFFEYSVSVSMRTGMPKINREELNQYIFMAPSVKEQTQIGNFFKHLDDIIALHQQELDALKETKKAFLQKMFV
ncbi:restriction endonuclease subunit S [Paenibacillus sp. S-12]|uniref:restriction endonuclease subunit S n=1 Tax=Paenibacillus sp. S-12 TaxID=3031371 RepID=UPI0025A018A5|nr:restriction endonuclease subunit S [Paenibacillus sp. S-12]